MENVLLELEIEQTEPSENARGSSSAAEHQASNPKTLGSIPCGAG